MPVPTDINSLSTTPSANSPVGSTDSPSVLDDHQRQAYAHIATLRDSLATTNTNLATTNTNLATTNTNLATTNTNLATTNTNVSSKAPIASPTFTGTVTAPQNFNVTQPYGALQVNGIDKLRFGADNSGALQGFRNILINGDMLINQRNVTIASAANGAYGPDRWKKVDASNMTQIVESGNFKVSTLYTLSGTGVTTQQITSPASGNWTLPNIPIAATKVQLEEGSIATLFEQRPIGLELSLCQRYYCKTFPLATPPAQNIGSPVGALGSVGVLNASGPACQWNFPVQMRTTPTITTFNPHAENPNWRNEVNTANINVVVAGNISDHGVLISAGTAGTSTAVWFIHATASAEL